MFLIFFTTFIYLLIGFISLINALLFIELGRPKDLIHSGLLILIGTLLIIYKNILSFKISFIFTLNALLISFYFIENFSCRWNQLSEKEKFNIKNLSGLKKNFSIVYEIISLDLKNLFFNDQLKNIFRNNAIKKKWVRKEDNNNTSYKEASSKQYMSNIKTTDFSKKDIINDEKINTENTKIDK